MNPLLKSEKPYTIRPFRPDDQESARQLILNGLGEHFGWIDPARNPDLDDIQQMIVHTGGYFIVVEKNKEIIGTGALLEAAPGVGRIARMSVKPGERKQGVGQTVVAHLRETAVARQYHTLLVETNHDWDDAIRLYQQCGFEEYDRDEESVHLRWMISPEG